MEEPSVLDWVKAKLTPWRGPAPKIPPSAELPKPEETQPAVAEPSTAAAEAPAVLVSPASLPAEAPPKFLPLEPARPAAKALPAETAQSISISGALPWRSLLALFLALIAQFMLEPRPDRKWETSLILYAAAFALLVWGTLSGEWQAAPVPGCRRWAEPFTFRWILLEAGIASAGIAFFLLGGNRFNAINLFFWLASLFLIVRGLWLRDPGAKPWLARLISFLRQPGWQLIVTRWTLLVLAAAALVVFFRVTHLVQTPPEMVSDQAEKLLDVWDLIHGQAKIFFERNTGREGFQMYLTAAIIQIFNTGYSFLSLKIGTTIMGLITLVFLYLIGEEVGNRRVGLLAATLAGIAYWPNVITRVALRFTLYPAFAAPALYFLIRGIRRSNRNDFILSGIFLGLGLHGYSPFRVVPIVVVLAVALYLIHRQSQGNRRAAALGLGITAFVSLIVFLPLLRYWFEHPELFSFRTMTRLGSIEQPLPGPPLAIFLNNLWKAMIMFFWDNGEVWPISVTHRPALDAISAALFFLGAGLLLVRYLRQQHWLDLFWLASIPVLMLPSILSLAFPSENPILNRTAGAIIPVFLIIGIALDSLMRTIESRADPAWGAGLAWGMAFLFVFGASQLNYNLVFVEYQRSYELSAWNTSEMGKVIRDFAETVGSPETAWVVGYPYWVDTRLVGMNAGYPIRDTVIYIDHFQETVSDPRAKLFLIKPEDQAAIAALRQLYPQGSLKEYISQVETKNFLMYFVPPTDQGQPAGD